MWISGVYFSIQNIESRFIESSFLVIRLRQRFFLDYLFISTVYYFNQPDFTYLSLFSPLFCPSYLLTI